jgi:glyoxylase-like metal-dependent hydrolase (beta-lactamase superfamily II)
MAALVDVLSAGYADDRVASTVTLVRDGDRLIVVDPGMVADRALILDPLRRLGVAPQEITDVVLSHHHPDHTMNIALFEHALVHDYMATYSNDLWVDHEPGDFVVSESVRLLLTPGHSGEDVTTLVDTADGLVALTHLWWTAEGPAQDPFAVSMEVLAASRRHVIDLAPVLVIPGHGPAFELSDAVPR